MYKIIRSYHTGFTLIEVLVSVVILAILSALAVPAYKSYAVKSKVLEGVLVVDQVQKFIDFYYIKYGVMPSSSYVAKDFNSSASANVIMLDKKDNVESLTFVKEDNDYAYISVKLAFDVGETGRRVLYAGGKVDNTTGSIRWKCGLWDIGSIGTEDINDLNYLPKNCQDTNVVNYSS